MKVSFKPFVDLCTTAVFVGTLPSEKSLGAQQYYAHPQNKFWRLLYDVFEMSYEVDYEQRLRFLQSKGFGLWDVIKQAHREGSLDSSIQSYELNDFEGLLSDYPRIKTFYFTSKQGFNWYYKKYKDSLGVALVVLASPSPANARLSYEQKLTDWKDKIKNPTLKSDF